ncbi:MAG TPA: sigma-70 family RNA polymerase sigma factor [Pyrinomonadaceae bacterium]|nr:sigma-70 family RNA polymerase sigma factor [Pyrinomonadaceae bacterium]
MSSTGRQRPDDPFPATGLERSDAELIRACRDGSQTAWDELVARYQRLIYSIPRRAGLTDEQSADVFQEVFLTLFEKIDELEQPEKVRSWIVTTAKFKTWGTVRGSKGHYSPETEEAMEQEMANLPDAAPLADDVLIELEQQHLIRTAMKQLEERCQKILSMLYLRTAAASYAEVADAVGVGETSISPLRSRCLKKLEKLLWS